MRLAARVGGVLFVLAAPACCVAASTRVRTPKGEVAAGTLAVGDAVESVDVLTGEALTGTIVQIRRARRECLALRLPNGTLVCTPDHPLYSPERAAYRPASDWVTGGARTLLIRSDAGVEPVAVEAVEAYAGVHEVVDLTLAGEPRNFVAAGVVVHNKSDDGKPYPIDDSVDAIKALSGPDLSLDAVTTRRNFRIHACYGDEPISAQDLWLGVDVYFENAPVPADGQQRIVAFFEFEGERTANWPVGELGSSSIYAEDPWITPSAACTDGLRVTFKRSPEPPDGAVDVDWEVTVNATLPPGSSRDRVTLSIEPESP